MKLTDTRCRTAPPGQYTDGHGLTLRVRSGARGISRTWVYRYYDGRNHEMGLGAYPVVTLQRARELATEARRDRADHRDPIDTRRAVRLTAGTQMTFRQAATEFMASMAPGWGTKHHRQWNAILTRYGYPLLGSLQVAEIAVADIERTLWPIWNSRRVTAQRFRTMLEQVLDYSKARGFRTAENPARWRGHLEHVLPNNNPAVQHFAAMPYRDISGFMETLGDGNCDRALKLIILTACRANEVLGATWGEINFSEAVWTIPADRMKGGRAHRVPLSAAAITLLGQPGNPEERIFPITLSSLDKFRRKLGVDGTAHGFRSSFRDWAGECTSTPRDIIEMCLAHKVANATEAAYARSDLLEKRRALMDLWGAYVTRANVIQLRAVS